MPETGIYLNTDFYPWSRLKSYQGDESVLQFCHDWLDGRDRFTVLSSGSTGEPKAIDLTRFQMEFSAVSTAKVLQPETSDQLFLSLNSKTIGGTMTLVRAMEWNLNVYVVPPSGNPMALLGDEHPCTICSLVPLQLHDLLPDRRSLAKLNRFRVILLGGAAVDSLLYDAIQTLIPIVYHTYGMTETCSHIALRQLNGTGKQERFYPLEGVNITLSNQQTLIIGAPMAGHLPLKTNDLAKIFPDGSFEVLGRSDRTLISGGIKIQLDELERLLSPLFIKTPFFLFGLPDPRLGQKLVLVLESEPFATEGIEKEMKALAPEYKAPKEIIFAPRFERTSSGKTDRIKTIRKWVKTS